MSKKTHLLKYPVLLCSTMTSEPPIPVKSASPPPAAQMPSSTPISKSLVKSTAREMTAEAAKLLQSTPLLIDSHPNRDMWPDWIALCVKALEGMCKGPLWKCMIWDRLELENRLGYPDGKVHHLIIDLEPQH